MERLRGGTIGMDVDRGAIKAVQISKAADGFVLQHVGYHRLPEGAVVEGEVADSEMLAREIKQFWDLHSFRGKSVVLGVAGRNVIVRFVDFPRLSPEDLDSAMSFQAEEHVPMPLDDAVLDHIVLGPSTENPEDDRVLLVAAHRAMISGYTAATRSGGLRPIGIDVKALALTRSALPEVLFDNEETVLLLDIGTELSNLVIVQNRMPTLTQFIPLGFRDFSQTVAEAADIEADEADRQALNPRANIGSLFHEPDENRIQSPSEAETLALDEYKPENEAEGSDDETEDDADDVGTDDTGRSGRWFGEAREDGDGETSFGGDESEEARETDSSADEERSGEGDDADVGGLRRSSPGGEDEVNSESRGGGTSGGDDGVSGGDDGPGGNVGGEDATDSERGEYGRGGGFWEGGDADSRDGADGGEETSGRGGNSGETIKGESPGTSGSRESGSRDDAAASDEARTEELSSDPALMYDVRRGLEDAAGRLAEEVQRSVEFHNSRPDAREVSRILISGEGALVRGLDSYIEDLLGVATERARPAAKLTDNRSNVSDEQLGAMEPVLAIALGLAMEGE